MGKQNGPEISLAELHRRMSGCRLCLIAGYSIYPRAIFSGQAEARIMMVGQAPGITEKEAGRPFNAGSGTRLFNWLKEAGINEYWFRAEQYITAITKCYPGRAASGSGDRMPSKTEQRLCQPYLEDEIKLVDPELIIPVGRLAIGLFYPSRAKLSEIIGTQERLDGRWVVPLPHPSGASRWHQIGTNREMISRAVMLIRDHILDLYPGL
ncbi:MAG: uracil-DNA glycosylase family protein [Anaerolineales bacterium]